MGQSAMLTCHVKSIRPVEEVVAEEALIVLKVFLIALDSVHAKLHLKSFLGYVQIHLY